MEIVSKDYKFAKDTSIVDVVQTFMAAEKIGGTQPNIKRILGDKKLRREKISFIAAQIKSNISLDFEKKYIEDALSELASEYLCLEFNEKYQRISPQIFDLERSIEKEDEEKRKIKTTIPLFAKTSFGLFNRNENFEKWTYHKRIETPRMYNLTVSSKIPPLCIEAKDRAREITQEYMLACHETMNEKNIGDIFFKDIVQGKGVLDFSLYWIPSPKELEIELEEVDKDPLLIAKIYDNHYLVAQWDVLGEERYEHYINEMIEKRGIDSLFFKKN